MEVDDVQCKFPRASNGKKMGEKYNQDEEEEGEKKRGVAARGGGLDLSGGVGRFYGWPSSRIVRVSRASGGKDRHSKVLTSKGLRDRRVRLSVNTAIQFYDLQDRLGYDQPSKAVEWLLKAAASSIDELPPMNTPFPDTPRQFSDEKRSSTSDHQLGFDSAEVDMDGNGGGDPNYSQNQVTNPSACSSNSENSKGSGLSLSRSESRIKARERAKERVAEKEKEKESEPSQVGSLNPISQTTSFTELLSAGINNVNNSPNSSFHRNPSAGGGGSTNESVFFQKSPRHWSSSTTPMDYFSTSLLGPPTGTRPMQMHLANPPLFSVSGDHNNHPELYSFVPDHLVSVVNSNSNNQNNGGSEYNLNFTISSSSGLAGYNRGTLQSNSSPSQLPHHLQRLIPLTDSSSPQSTFFIGAAAPVENNHYHHQFLSGYDSRLQLCYGDGHANNGTRHSGQKGKGKN